MSGVKRENFELPKNMILGKIEYTFCNETTRFEQHFKSELHYEES